MSSYFSYYYYCLSYFVKIIILQFEGLLTEPDSPENCGSDIYLHLNGRVTF